MIRLLLLLTFALCACKEDTQSEQETIPVFCHDLDDIRSSGKIVALCDASSTSYFVYKGVAMGFEYELLSRFAENLGLALEMKVVEDMDCINEMLENGDVVEFAGLLQEYSDKYILFRNVAYKPTLDIGKEFPERFDIIFPRSLALIRHCTVA